MTAAAVLALARAAGLTLQANGDRLRWRGPRPSAELLDELKAHKADILSLLTPNDTQPHLIPMEAVPEAPQPSVTRLGQDCLKQARGAAPDALSPPPTAWAVEPPEPTTTGRVWQSADADYPVQPTGLEQTETDEHAADAAESLLPAAGTSERDALDGRYHEAVKGLLHAALQRPPSGTTRAPSRRSAAGAFAATETTGGAGAPSRRAGAA